MGSRRAVVFHLLLLALQPASAADGADVSCPADSQHAGAEATDDICAMLQTPKPRAAAAALVTEEQKMAYWTPYMQEWLERSGLEVSNILVPAHESALVVVDMSIDFVWDDKAYTNQDVAEGMSPCSKWNEDVGSPNTSACFGAWQGRIAAEAVSNLLKRGTYTMVLASYDDHPADHCSFASAAGDGAVLDPDAAQWPGKFINLPPGCAGRLKVCDPQAFHKCVGTRYAEAGGQQGNQTGWQPAGVFPPHSATGFKGTLLHPIVEEALNNYPGTLHLVSKARLASTDSFGVFPYTEDSFNFYVKAGLLDPSAAPPASAPCPACAIRSMLTWEKNYTTYTGASRYKADMQLEPSANAMLKQVPLAARREYYQPPITGHADHPGFVKTQGHELVRQTQPKYLLVTGLVLDWCVLDTALNYKALYPDTQVCIVLDATRPSLLSKPVAAPHLRPDPAGLANQCTSSRFATPEPNTTYCWLHAPRDVAAVLDAAGVEVIFSDQVIHV